jgi:hypothetical protein
MTDVTKQQAIGRYEDLINGLKHAETPAACNGFAVLMKDSIVCILEFQKLALQIPPIPVKNGWPWSKTVAVLGSVATVSASVCLTVLQLAGVL